MGSLCEMKERDDGGTVGGGEEAELEGEVEEKGGMRRVLHRGEQSSKDGTV